MGAPADQPPPGYGYPGQGYPGQGYPGQGYPGYGYPGYGVPGPPPPSRLGWAIASIVFFWPLAIPAFIYSSRVESAWYRGDFAGAQRASSNARTCGIVALALGVVMILIWLAVFIFVFGVDACNNGLRPNC